MPTTAGPYTFNAFTIRREPGSATQADFVFPSAAAAKKYSRGPALLRRATFTLEPGEVLAVSSSGSTDTHRLFIDFARAHAVALDVLGYVVILTPSPWSLTAESADGTEVVIGQQTGWKHDFIKSRLVYSD